jgi:hypothetical protein
MRTMTSFSRRSAELRSNKEASHRWEGWNCLNRLQANGLLAFKRAVLREVA